MTLTAPPAAPLLALCSAVGIDLNDLVRAETPGRVSDTRTVTGDRLTGLSQSLVDDALDAYGPALKFAVAVGDLVEFEVADGTYDPERLSDLKQRALPGDHYAIELRLDTAMLARAAAGEGPADSTVTVFLFQQTLAELLRGSVDRVEEVLWGDVARRAVALVGDRNVNIDGLALTILGGATGTADPRAPELEPDLVEKARTRRRHRLPWDSSIRTNLTPWHLYHETADGDPDLLSAVDGLFCDLFVLYTCDSANLDRNGDPTGEYRTAEQNVAVRIGTGGPRIPDPAEGRAALSLLDWCYAPEMQDGGLDWTAERLPFVQVHLARILGSTDAEARRATMLRGMTDTEEAVRWQWRAFVDGRVSTYLDSVREVEEAVVAAVDSYAERSRALFEDVNKAVLAAVGTVVGTFIASTLNDTFDETLFTIGMYVYGGYVVVFPGAVGLSGAMQRATDIETLFRSRLARFGALLSRDKVDAIIGTRVSTSRRSLRVWIAVFAGIYVSLGVLAVTAVQFVPRFV